MMPTTLPLSRRTFLGGGAALAAAGLAAPCRGEAVPALPNPVPEAVAPDVWVLRGADARIAPFNGGAIANIGIVRTPAGAVVIDAGVSMRHGMAVRAAAERLASGRIARVYVTHIHPDHSFGAGAFPAGSVATSPAVHADLARNLADLADAMWQLLQESMRGTEIIVPDVVIPSDHEVIGGRRFALLSLAGHSAADLAILDTVSGTLFAGDLVFHDRAPSTPHADLAAWRRSLDRLSALPFRVLVPGHGPIDRTGVTAIAQTRDWLDWLEQAFTDAAARGLDIVEVGQLPIPERFARLAEARYELARSAIHLYPAIEQAALGPTQTAG